MKLLRTQTLGLEPFFDFHDRPEYVVLSHTWRPGHPNLTGVADPELAVSGPTSEVIRRACDVAEQLGYEYLWAECVCVDGSSPEEVSEAINYSFQWFQQAAACLAYLNDLPPEAPDDEASWRQCEWWSRAWTLPELLAPSKVRFYDGDWNFRGTKTSAPLLEVIARITHISEDVLRNGSLIPRASVAKRMSWAATRKARRVEDRAYSLLGIFGVRMQAIYGEGTASFMRLQEEILKATRDMSLLAWEAQPDDTRPFRGLFASSPEEFVHFITFPPQWRIPFPFEGEIQSSSDKDLSITAPFIPCPSHGQQVLLLDLGALHEPQKNTVLVLFRYNDYYVRPATKATVTSTEPGNSTTRTITAMKDLDAVTSRAVADTPQIPIFANGNLTLLPAEKTPGQPIPAASLPPRGPTYPTALARRCRNQSIAESSDIYVISCASTSPASMSPMLNAGLKRSLPTYVMSNHEDKRAKTRTAALPSKPGSDSTALPDGRSDVSSGSISSQEDLSVSDGAAPGPPPALDESHPFLAVADELTEKARSEFNTWRKTAPQADTLYLACPFRARTRDPERHASCLKRAALRQPRDVKIHLWRSHRLPHYCPVCYALFETASSRNEHIVQRTCELKPRPVLDGVSEDQRQKLAKKSRLNASREEQWLAIWDILFPGEPPPSPYPEGEDGKLIGLVREFWEERGQEIVSGFLKERRMLGWEVRDEERGLAALHALVLQRLVDEIFVREGWEMVPEGAVPHGLPREGSTMLGLLPGANVSVLGAVPIRFPFRGSDTQRPVPVRRRRRGHVTTPAGSRDSIYFIRYNSEVSEEKEKEKGEKSGMPPVP